MYNKQYDDFIGAIAQYYNVPKEAILRGESFAIEVPQASLLGQNIQQKSDFLKQINMMFVEDIKGKKLFGANEGGITGRKKDGRHLAELNHKQGDFELHETDSGVVIPWAIFDSFARHKEQLEKLYAEYVQNQIALDIITIGWNGKTVAENTKAEDLSDVNKGWFTLLAEGKPKNFMKDAGSGKIKIFGEGADYENLDELASDLRRNLDVRHQNRNDLVFLVGAELVGVEDKLLRKNGALTPTERAALGSHNLLGSFGGMPSQTPPNFPERGACVTTLKNLSVYTQSKSVRRAFRSDEDRKGVVNSYYRQEGYVVEDLGLMTAIDSTAVVLPGDEE